MQRLVKAWDRQVERIAVGLELKALPDIATAFDVDAEVAWLEPQIRANMQRLAEVGAWDVLEQWNPTSEGWSPEMIAAWIAQAARTNAERWTIGVRDGLADAVRDTEHAEDNLRDFLASNALAVALATAFITEAASFGSFDAAKKSGLATKTWRVTSKNPRPDHAAQNGETVDIDDVFSNGLRWPGDHFGTAKDNANCSCRVDYGT